MSLILDATLDIPWIYIFVTVCYALRSLCGPRLDPLSWLTLYAFRPILDKTVKPKPSYTAGPPKRFAQVCGTVLALLYCLVRMAGHHKEVANYIAGKFFFPAIADKSGVHLLLIVLEVYFEICGGCAMFACFMLIGIVPQV